MNLDTFTQIYQNKLTPKQKQVLSLFLSGKTKDEMMMELNVTHPTAVTHHLRNISKVFDIIPEIDTDYCYSLVELFWKCKPDLVSIKLLKDFGFITDKPPYPDSHEPLKSPFYIERQPIEKTCYQLITEPGQLIHIKAPEKMGKTSLIKRIIAQAKEHRYQTCYLNLSLIETSKFQTVEGFLLSFYHAIIHQLPSVPPLKEWDNNTPIMINCTRHFRNLLKHIGKVFLLVLDEVDKLFEYPEIYQNFFPMLRHWYEQGKESETWSNLRLIVANSTEDYGRLDIHQSPFNVGYPIKLEEFNQEQVITLASRHGIATETAIKLMKLVDGHPYLLRLAFYHLYYQNTTLDQLLKDAPTDIGIYKNHLLRYLEILQSNPELKTVFKKILSQNSPVDLKEKTIIIYQLESMGLIRIQSNSIQVRCNLYQQYFQERI